MKSVELFAGAGGLALAVSEAGFEHLAVVERDRYACETINANRRRGIPHLSSWPSVQPIDVRAFDYSGIRGPVDLVSGGPPCQPFSLGGKHGAYNDARDMFPQAVRAIAELNPRAFMFENVRGLTRQTFSSYFEYILLQLQYPDQTRRGDEDWSEHLARLERGHTGGAVLPRYRVVFQVLNAADFGVPQRRERVFIVGFRSDLNLAFNFPTRPTHSQDALLWSQYVTCEYWDRHSVPRRHRPEPPARLAKRVEKLRSMMIPPAERPWQTVRDAIGDLPDPQSQAARAVPNHELNAGARRYPGHTGSPLDQPGKTLKAGGHGVPGGENMLTLPDGAVRYFTVRESARLQTFPDEFHFPGSWTETMRQLGNAVPTRLGYVVASRVAARLATLTAE